MSAVAVIPGIILLSAMIILPFAVGIFVFRDAKRRGMNAILWAFVSAAAPALIGLLVYLLVRGNYSDLRCPRCDAAIRDTFVVCPKCGTKLRAYCPNCAMAVEADWKVCPRCVRPLPEFQPDIQKPSAAKDKSVWKILVIVLLIPALLIAVLLLGLSVSSSAGSSGFAVTTVDEYSSEINSQAILREVQQWLEDIDPGTECAHVLSYTHTDGNNAQHFYLVYVPGADSHFEMGQADSIFGTTITLGLQNTGNKGNLFHIVSSADKLPNLKIKLDGKKLPCEMRTVEYNPTIYIIEPNYTE